MGWLTGARLGRLQLINGKLFADRAANFLGNLIAQLRYQLSLPSRGGNLVEHDGVFDAFLLALEHVLQRRLLDYGVLRAGPRPLGYAFRKPRAQDFGRFLDIALMPQHAKSPELGNHLVPIS